MKTQRWGILATGNIANDLASAIKDCEGAELLAVASRSQTKADEFAEKWSIPRAYGSYEELVNDPDVDVVYIATPHNFHYENMKLCLSAGKHVLCEKAFTINAQQAEECIQLAREKNLFLMEAMWTRFFPAVRRIREMIEEKVLGEIRFVQADFFHHLPFDAEHRLYNPNLGGGALLDLGIYPVSFAVMLLGLPEVISSSARLGETGVDEVDSLIFCYENCSSAQVSCGLGIEKPREVFILGTKGCIKIPESFFRPARFTLQLYGQEAEEHSYPYPGNGYGYELEEVMQCLAQGKLESEIMPLDETLDIMQLCDRLRAEWGVVYPEEMHS